MAVPAQLAPSRRFARQERRIEQDGARHNAVFHVDIPFDNRPRPDVFIARPL
jgi:hypothetical protein